MLRVEKESGKDRRTERTVQKLVAADAGEIERTKAERKSGAHERRKFEGPPKSILGLVHAVIDLLNQPLECEC